MEPAPGGAWELRATERDLHGRPFERTTGRYPTQAACAEALERTYAGLIKMLQSSPGPGQVAVQQEVGNWTWTTTLPGQRPQETRAWCAEQAP